MSKFLFLPLVLLVSCLPVEEKAEESGMKKWTQPLVNQEDNMRVQAICDALRAKSSVLNILVSSSKEYKFSFAQKNCDDSKMPAAKIVPTTITSSNGNFFFTPKNGETFGFKNVETADEGVMETICNYGATLESPIRPNPSSKIGIWWTTFTDSSKCQAGFGNLCIRIETGTTKDGMNYKINSEEYIKFKVMDQNEGFFIERKLVSTAGCKDGKKLEMRAVLK